MIQCDVAPTKCYYRFKLGHSKAIFIIILGMDVTFVTFFVTIGYFLELGERDRVFWVLQLRLNRNLVQAIFEKQFYKKPDIKQE